MEAKRVRGTQDLDRLLVKLDGLSDLEIEQKGRDLYNRLYMTSNQSGVFQAHDGEKVYFWKRRFNHAFFVSPQKLKIDKARVERIKWIAEFIAGNEPSSECWLIPEPGNPTKRLYASFARGYLVWLERRATTDDWKFSTAYNARGEKIRSYVKRKGAKRIWKYGQR
ncbi:MAG TPA: hypothetical protein VF546_17585 [Pyrinomonadaceae bacterium]|jgi:hypothetical protein